jgi:hypothetical protein
MKVVLFRTSSFQGDFDHTGALTRIALKELQLSAAQLGFVFTSGNRFVGGSRFSRFPT